jgi:hypothetical protein
MNAWNGHRIGDADLHDEEFKEAIARPDARLRDVSVLEVLVVSRANTEGEVGSALKVVEHLIYPRGGVLSLIMHFFKAR